MLQVSEHKGTVLLCFSVPCALWSGRQLETYVDGNKTIEFEYDENGLRHRKTVKENGGTIRGRFCD